MAHGIGWKAGRIDAEDMPGLFARSKIVLGIGIVGYCDNLFHLKIQDFIGPMSGSMYLTLHNPDLEKLYEIGSEIETYKNPMECLNKVRYYLNNAEKAEDIGRAGRSRAEKDHNWDKRFGDLLEVVGVRKYRGGSREIYSAGGDRSTIGV